MDRPQVSPLASRPDHAPPACDPPARRASERALDEALADLARRVEALTRQPALALSTS